MVFNWQFPRGTTIHLLKFGLLTCVVGISRASAAPFASPGSVTIGVENATAYEAQSMKFWNHENRTVEFSRSHLSLAFATGGARVGLHYFPWNRVSLGGTVGFEAVSGSNTYQDNPGTWTTDVPTENTFVLSPRVGYALMFTESVGLWFRGGIGYERTKRRFGVEGNNYSRDSLGVASADVLFIFSPLPHLGILVGPTGDRSFIGGHFSHDQNGDWSNDARLWRLGVTSGILGYF
jgi:hypothetical protein